MSLRVAINGFGRIGRNYLRAAKKQQLDLDIVAVNDLTDTATLALLLKYDSVHGRYDGTVETDGDDLVVDGTPSRCSPSATRRAALEGPRVDIVIESTGFFTKRTTPRSTSRPARRRSSSRRPPRART
jgi:glyceraldehyde 3-phosphate dehydrogenase